VLYQLSYASVDMKISSFLHSESRREPRGGHEAPIPTISQGVCDVPISTTTFVGERETGLEPATSSLEGLRSTN
jgi:hypothetical protein